MKITAKQLFAIATVTNKRKADEEIAKDMKFVEEIIFPELYKSAEQGEFYTTIQFDTYPSSIINILHGYGFTTKCFTNNKIVIKWG